MEYLFMFYADNVVMSTLLILTELALAFSAMLLVRLRFGKCSVLSLSAVAVGILMCVNLIFLCISLTLYTSVSTEEFNQKVVKAIPEFKGTAHCEKEGLAVKGIYQFKTTRLENALMTYTVELDTVLPQLAYACSKGYYLTDLRELGLHLRKNAQAVAKAEIASQRRGKSRLISAGPAVAQ